MARRVYMPTQSIVNKIHTCIHNINSVHTVILTSPGLWYRNYYEDPNYCKASFYPVQVQITTERIDESIHFLHTSTYFKSKPPLLYISLALPVPQKEASFHHAPPLVSPVFPKNSTHHPSRVLPLIRSPAQTPFPLTR